MPIVMVLNDRIFVEYIHCSIAARYSSYILKTIPLLMRGY
jgi:hypothetical protein